MIPENVTLIVKAPNQQIEDQNIECQSSWTVKQLKCYLSDVYPSKPKTDEQKIIYSGQLLDDNIILKDILRIYESQVSHTMHLVCTPKRAFAEEPSPPSEGLQHGNAPAATDRPAEVTLPEGLRHRNVPATERPAAVTRPRPAVVTRPEITQNDQNHTVEIQNYFNTYVYTGRPPPDANNTGDIYFAGSEVPVAWTNHMIMMQRAYLQYMRQYADMWQVPGPPPAAPPPTPPPAPAPAPAPAPRAPADDDGGARDWLDHLYAASRLAILLSLVYLYGSPARLLLVLLLAAVGYLHQIGFFRDLHVAAPQPVPNADVNNAANNDVNVANEANAANNVANVANIVANAANNAANAANNAANMANAANNVANAANNVANAANNVANSVNDEANAANNATNAPNDAPNEPEPTNNAPNEANVPNNGVNPPTVEVSNANNNAQNQQSLLAVTWMIFASFFASLIPDIN